jgi:FkbM family methyltransferase
MHHGIRHILAHFKVRNALDIGAHTGEYGHQLLSFLQGITSDPRVFSIEANKSCEEALRAKQLWYTIACLCDTEKEAILYAQRGNPQCTGTSLYREITHFYDDYNLDERRVVTTTLDSLLSSQGNGVVFDYMKIDTQGAELDIIKGASETLKNIKVMVVETDLIGYNKGCPHQSVVVSYLESIGFVNCGVIEDHYHEGKLCQQDLLFLNQECANEAKDKGLL